MAKLTLGLDLGPNSIGWALIDEKGKKLVASGVRVFPEGVDQFDTAKEVSRSEGRRVARGMRRQTNRRRRRKANLTRALVEIGLLPADADARAAVLQLDPYELRSRALDEKLAPHELGRVFRHLAQRRGFLSNRKKDAGDKEVQGMLAEINELEQKIQESGCKTLGQWLHRQSQQLDHKNRDPDNHDLIRRRHTRRAMYEAEFDAIWQAQRDLGHADLLTDRLKYGKLGRPQKYPVRPVPRSKDQSLLDKFGLHGLIFFQRPMYWPRSVVGSCELEPRQKRCPKADRRAQRFRLLHEVNNLKYSVPGEQDESRLSPEQRTLLLDKLGKKDAMTFDEIRKELGFLESVRFNLERGQRPKLQGHVVDARLAKAVGKKWHDRPEEEKNDIVRLLLDNQQDDDAIERQLVSRFGLTEEQAKKANETALPSGYVNLSLKALNNLLPHMEKGLIYQSVDDPEKSALHAAGYLRRDQLKRRLFDRLPNPEYARDCPLGDIPNPVVKRTLTEMRKVVNAILREYGRPTEIHVEMGRDVATRPKKGTLAYRKYQDRIAENRDREQRRSDAADRLRENRITVNRDNITRYLLWQDQNEACVYSGEAISFARLFGGDVDVDHILPYSKCLDDSQNNKVVCVRKANADKGNQTPYEWLAQSRPSQYDEVCARVNRLMRDGRISYQKYRRFLQKELKLDDFISRQLNDTRYIACLAGEYLKCLFDKKNEHQVLGLKGQLTAELRHQWGLDTVLADLPDSPAWQEHAKLRDGEKNRADHRHHAVDAVVIALTDRKRLLVLSDIHRQGGSEATGEEVLTPWPSLRDDVLDVMREIKVSHRSERKVSGQLHEETLYGKTEKDGFWVARKQVVSLSPNEIENIRDAGIKRIIVDRLREHGIEFGRGRKVDPAKWKAAMANLAMPSGVPIRKVRVVRPELTIRAIREGTPGEAHVKPGSTHHLCLFEYTENGKTKREAVFVTMLEATARLKRGETIIQRTHPEHPDARFIMSLSRGEMVLADFRGEEKLLVFRTAASTTEQMWFAEHTDARRSADYQKHTANANTLDARKVTVDPLGRIRWAND